MVSDAESNLAEYLIVIEQNTGIEKATVILEKYEVTVIRDLKKNRYLIGLKDDPGIERLKKDVEDSEYIKYIQPNLTYTTQ